MVALVVGSSCSHDEYHYDKTYFRILEILNKDFQTKLLCHVRNRILHSCTGNLESTRWGNDKILRKSPHLTI